MADGVPITAGSGTTILTDDTGAGGHAQVMKLAISTDGSGTLIPADATNGMLVNVAKSVVPDTLTGSGSLTGTAQAVTLTLAGRANAAFQLSGTWTATITFEATTDGTNWTTIYAYRAGDNTITQTVVNSADNDVYRCSTAGFLSVRARCSAFTSGTIEVSALASAGASGVFLNFPIPPGTSLIGSATAVGDVAHDAADSGNPIKIGAKASTALPTAVANSDRANAISDVFGRQLTGHIDGAMQVWKSANYTTTQTGTIIWAPASGKKIVITSIVIGSYGSTAARLILYLGTAADTTYTAGTDQLVLAASFAPGTGSKPGLVFTPAVPIYAVTADHNLHITTDAALSVDLAVYGYEI